MPTETIIVISLIVAIFALFAGVLAWADLRGGGGWEREPAE